VCCLFTVNCSSCSKGALAGIKDPGPLEEAITHGDLSTAKKLLGITESGELTLVGITQAVLYTNSAIQSQLQEYLPE